jgi:hypothetical protein
MLISRESRTLQAQIGTSAPTVGFSLSNFAGGSVFFPASGITQLTWYGSIDGKTYVPVGDGAGNGVTTTPTEVAGSYASCPLIPAVCFALPFLACYASGAGDTGGVIGLGLKS